MLGDGDRLVRSTSRALRPKPIHVCGGRHGGGPPWSRSHRVLLRPATGRQDAHRRWA